jgi:hypothetical protein
VLFFKEVEKLLFQDFYSFRSYLLTEEAQGRMMDGMLMDLRQRDIAEILEVDIPFKDFNYIPVTELASMFKDKKAELKAGRLSGSAIIGAIEFGQFFGKGVPINAIG